MYGKFFVFVVIGMLFLLRVVFVGRGRVRWEVDWGMFRGELGMRVVIVGKFEFL